MQNTKKYIEMSIDYISKYATQTNFMLRLAVLANIMQIYM